MGRANVYLPDELERRVKAAQIPVSEVCQRALVIARGRIVAEGTVSDLSTRLTESMLLSARARVPFEALAAAVRAVPGARALENLTLDGRGEAHLRCLVDRGAVEAVRAALAAAAGEGLGEVRTDPPRLEDFFHEVTRGLSMQEAGAEAGAGEAAA